METEGKIEEGSKARNMTSSPPLPPPKKKEKLHETETDFGIATILGSESGEWLVPKRPGARRGGGGNAGQKG